MENTTIETTAVLNGTPTQLASLKRRWSGKARKFFASLPEPTVVEFYWYFWSTGGKKRGCYNGFKDAPGIGFVTYTEIRKTLLEAGYPDLNEEMFTTRGFCPICYKREILEELVTGWFEFTPEKKQVFRDRMIRIGWCDGH